VRVLLEGEGGATRDGPAPGPLGLQRWRLRRKARRLTAKKATIKEIRIPLATVQLDDAERAVLEKYVRVKLRDWRVLVDGVGIERSAPVWRSVDSQRGRPRELLGEIGARSELDADVERFRAACRRYLGAHPDGPQHEYRPLTREEVTSLHALASNSRRGNAQ